MKFRTRVQTSMERYLIIQLVPAFIIQRFYDTLLRKFLRWINFGRKPTKFQYIPAARTDPRLVTSGPHNRMTVRTIPGSIPQWELLDDLTGFPEKEVLSCASSNYAGFSKLEHDMENVIESAIRTLPWCPAPPALEERLRKTCAEYMGFEACITAPFGFGIKLIAFESIANIAKVQGCQMVFLRDRDAHNSTLTGCFYQKEAKVH